jgi:glycosyltransferase involved in cell wall biosynthesis
MKHLTWTLCAHVLAGLESEFENFSKFLSLKRPDDRVFAIGLPLARGRQSVRSFGVVSNGVLPSLRRQWVWGYPIHVGYEVVCPVKLQTDVFIGFDPASVLYGRRSGASLQVLWGIDFVPTRHNSILDAIARRIEARAMRSIDCQIENNAAAMQARQQRSGSHPPFSKIVPITVDRQLFPNRANTTEGIRLAFLGGLNERTGASRLIPIMAKLQELDAPASLDIIGSGPLEMAIRRENEKLGLRIKIHGFVKGDAEVAQILSRCNFGLAPFRGAATDFTQFADPQKLKFYLSAGLHTVLSDSVPSGAFLKSHGVVTLLAPSADDTEWAETIIRIARDGVNLAHSQDRAIQLSRLYDREAAYTELLADLMRLIETRKP